MILAQRWEQSPQHILQDLKVLRRYLQTAPVCRDNTAGCVSRGPGLCFVASVLLFRVGSLQIAEQQGHLASLLEYKLCILYIVKLKGVRLPFIRIAVVQANQSSFYWREQDLMHFVTPPILKSSLKVFFLALLFYFIFGSQFTWPSPFENKRKPSIEQQTERTGVASWIDLLMYWENCSILEDANYWHV